MGAWSFMTAPERTESEFRDGADGRSAASSPDRFIPITDCLNFRHMGGYPAKSGRVTRGDRLFRSGWFEFRDPQDARRFESCGIETIFDLRTEAERSLKPLRFAPSRAPEVIELGIDKGSMGPYMEKISRMPPAEIDTRAAMTRMYSGMLDEALPQLRELFAGILRASGPILVMCSSGKDRTGVGSALILAALGVAKDVIFRDYLLSADVYKGKEDNFARRHNYEKRGIPIELIRDVLTVHAEYLEAAWRRAEEVAGSVDGFLANALNLSDGDLARLQGKLTR